MVATPGRLIDLIEREARSSSTTSHHVIVDEADRMADMGFMPQVEWLLRHMSETEHQTLLFSATLDGVVNTLIRRYQHEPSMHEVAGKEVTVEEMTHRFIAVHKMDKPKVAAAIANSAERTIMFTRTKVMADRLADALKKEGVRAAAIHGDLRQTSREKSLKDFMDGKLRALVATDVAARGIHVDDVDIVLQYDPPSDHKTYLHRAGRTARAGESGLVVTLSLWDEELEVKRLQKRIAVVQPPPRCSPTTPGSPTSRPGTPSRAEPGWAIRWPPRSGDSPTRATETDRRPSPRSCVASPPGAAPTWSSGSVDIGSMPTRQWSPRWS